MEKVKLSTGSSDKLKGTWDIGTNLSFERDRSFGFSWPQRNYTCSFCRKEFKSAQALGGHMNVHRRDRAKQMTTQQRHHPSSPTTRENSLSSNPNPNPNPNPYPKHPPTVLLAKPAAAARFLPYNMNNNYQASNSLIITSFSNSHEHLDDDDLVSPQIRDIRKKLGMEANFNLYQVGEFKGFKKQENDDQYRVWKKREFLGLDLNLGTQTRDAKEDLDLELRLGSS